jgi:hypothetical protein
MKKYYLIEVKQGVEPVVHGSYRTEFDQDYSARKIREKQNDADSLFWVTFDQKEGLVVGSYMANFFFPVEINSID